MGWSYKHATAEGRSTTSGFRGMLPQEYFNSLLGARERENEIKVRNKTGLVGSDLCQFDVSIIFLYILSICLEFNSDVGRELILSSYFFAIH